MKIVIHPEYISKRVKPKNFEDDDIELFAHEFSSRISETFVETIFNPSILKDTIFYECKFLTKHTHTFIQPTIKEKIFSLRLFLREHEIINKGLWITDDQTFGYYHWLTDALTRLFASKGFIDDHLLLLPNYYKNINFIIKSLEILNIKYRFFKSNKRVLIKELLLPSHTAPTGYQNRKIINLVRESFIDNTSNAGKKIYISRRKARMRKVINEHEVIHLLTRYGFEIHCMEDYDFKKQTELMQEASHLFGIHGAGLTNMIFMPKGGKILELRNQESSNNCFYCLASELHHDYYYLLCKGNSQNTQKANINVNIEKLSKELELMM